MRTDRRYQDVEVREILRLAARSAEMSIGSVAGEDGMTLSAVQEIGQEAGIDPRNVAAAALHLDTRAQVLPPQRVLGMPVSVGRVIDLPRPLTNHEWDIVVGYLRDTFAAAGEVRVQGGAREWSNGNLRVLLEPTELGHRFRFSSLNRRFQLLASIGAGLVVTGVVFLAVLVPDAVYAGGMSFQEFIRLMPSILVAGGGMTYLAWARSGLRRWVRDRESQMEEIGVLVRALITRSPTGGSGS